MEDGSNRAKRLLPIEVTRIAYVVEEITCLETSPGILGTASLVF